MEGGSVACGTSDALYFWLGMQSLARIALWGDPIPTTLVFWRLATAGSDTGMNQPLSCGIVVAFAGIRFHLSPLFHDPQLACGRRGMAE
jgi:hypothetical protein